MNESRRTASEKSRVLSCLAMVAVVIGHSRPETLMGRVVGRFTLFAVPLFFTVSGFYFIKSLEKYDRMVLIKKKVKTLLVPYLCWCLLGWMVFRPGWGEMGMLELVQKYLVLPRLIHGWTSNVMCVCILGGIQLLSLGVMGEYIGRIYIEGKHRPRYIVGERSWSKD